MGPLAAIQSVFLNYFAFRGRAPRSEYWWFIAFYTIAAIAAGVTDGMELAALAQSEAPSFGGLAGLWTPWLVLITLIPYHTVSVRRLHDVGLSGWWMFGLLYLPSIAMAVLTIAALPRIAAGEIDLSLATSAVVLLCSLAFLVLMLWPGTRGENRFGPSAFYRHHAVGGGNDMAVANAASGLAPRTGGKSRNHSPWDAYLSLERAQYADHPDMQAARKQQVHSLYKQKILGLKDEPDAEQPG